MTRSETLYVVRQPHASDAIGSALRSAYGRDSLPDDMLRLIRQLDCNFGMRRSA